MVARVMAMALYLGLMVCLADFAMTAKTADDPPRNETLYNSRCGSCHALDVNRTGPRHRGLFGRKAGAVPDYGYSLALESSEVIWDQMTLDNWLNDPGKYIASSKMFVKVNDPTERAEIIAYLKIIFSPKAYYSVGNF
jgi:cytochrome c